MEDSLRRFWKVVVRKIPDSDPSRYSVTVEDDKSDPELRERIVATEPLGSLRAMLDCLFQRGALIFVNQSVHVGRSGVRDAVHETADLSGANDAMELVLEGQRVEVRPDASRDELLACLALLSE